MADVGRRLKVQAGLGYSLCLLLLSGAAPIEGVSPPTLQDIQVAGRVLHFVNALSPGTIVVAIVYNAAEPRSGDEAVALSQLLGAGLTVGNLVLRSVLVEQSHLAESSNYGAIFVAAGVDSVLLATALKLHRVPCLTRHLDQVAHGHCTVAIRSAPSVNITVSQENAAAAGVVFATAFRMMVQEI